MLLNTRKYVRSNQIIPGPDTAWGSVPDTFNGIRELCKTGELEVQIGNVGVDREIPCTILGNGFLGGKKFVLRQFFFL